MSKRVLMVLNNHYTHDPRVTNEAEGLVRHGYEVKVIAWDRKRKYLLHESINGIEIFRVRIPYILDKLIPFEILKVPIWQILAYKKALRLYDDWKFDVVHVHDWPDLPVGAWLKKKRPRLKLIYDSHEVWAYMVFTKRLPKWLNEIIWRELSLLQHADALITVGRDYKRYFIPYFPKISIIYNSKQRGKWIKPKTGFIKVVYVGGFDDKRCIHELLEAVSKTQYSAIKVTFAGPYVKGFTDRIKELSHRDSRIEYLGFIPRERVLIETEKGNAVWFVFKSSDPLYKIGMPNKLFEAIATGRTSICGKGTSSGEFVEKYKIGLAISCGVEEIKKTLIYLRENPKLVVKFGRRAYKVGEKYNWRRELEKLLALYKEVIGEQQ
ncbi:glycosyltransferase [Thermococcus sp.]|uniref:glycosyltransferase n=1 Tax=Thermococcus sp. TaxID=35749 RepID=UPI0019BAF94E|nr:glycosyltransferase [Thermococcus sp.]MBC7095435.1 glycosyltransferase [Thermococcus sp.]